MDLDGPSFQTSRRVLLIHYGVSSHLLSIASVQGMSQPTGKLNISQLQQGQLSGKWFMHPICMNTTFTCKSS
ncbi:hypothetical protein LINPERHAP2_LOCUS27484 [Linum perenne]